MNTIELRKAGITQMNTDAIVNAANRHLRAGSGVCGAIFKAAGEAQLQAACDKLGHCSVGRASVTPGFNTGAKYIIHAVGPRWQDGEHGEDILLRSAYTSALEWALFYKCKSVAFPLLSSGVYGYPLKGAWRAAIDACGEFLDAHPEADMLIVFAVRDEEKMKVGHEVLLNSDASRYKVAERGDWKMNEMPAARDSFILKRSFTEEQMAALRRGNIPQEMEDKWFWYMEGNTLRAYRSWTGNYIFRVDFKRDGLHTVTYNNDKEQYNFPSRDSAAAELNSLLDSALCASV